MQVLFDRILIEPETPDRVTEHGLLVPDSGQDEVTTGTVRAVGSGRMIIGTDRTYPFQVKISDRVLFRPFAGARIGFNGNNNCRLMSEGDILAVVEDDDD